jgi:hypothetical protein
MSASKISEATPVTLCADSAARTLSRKILRGRTPDGSAPICHAVNQKVCAQHREKALIKIIRAAGSRERDAETFAAHPELRIPQWNHFDK